MDSFELTKLSAAVLIALLAVMGISMLSSMLNPEPEFAVGYVVPGVEVAMPGDDHGDATEEPAEVSIAQLLATGDAGRGERVFNKCKSCHTLDEGGRDGTGPNLHNIVGASLAHSSGFSYSDAVKEHGGTWTYEALNAWIKNPKDFIPKNRMVFPGIRDDQQRADLILFLAQNTENPPALPVPEAAPEEEAAPEADTAPEGEAEPAGEAPAEEAPVEDAPVAEEAPAEEAPTEEAPAAEEPEADDAGEVDASEDAPESGDEAS